MKFTYLSLWALAGSASAYLATTTRYYDGQKGACGCGTDSGLDTWQLGGSSLGFYTAAGSQAFFDTDGSSWCGAGCGKCYNLTSTGSAACDGCGEGGVAGESIIVMVTNLCPYNGNEVYCPSVGATNEYGYSYHFDIMAESEVFGDNVVVDFEPVTCPGQAETDWETCQCYGETDTDETPASMTSAAAAASAATSTASVVSSSSSSTTSKAASSATSATSTLVTVSTSVSSAVEEVSTSAAASSTSTSVSAVVEPSSSSVVSVVEPSSTSVSSKSPAGAYSTTSTTETTVITSTSTIYASSTPATSTSSSSGAVQTLYGQCGGINWTGATACPSSATCKVQNPYYSQCVSSS